MSLRDTVRTSEDKLKGIKETDLSDAELHTSINIANQFVEEHLTGEGVSSQTLEDVETLLAAHFVSVGVDKEETDFDAADISASFTIEGGQGLNATQFGQQAKRLDPTGILEQEDSKDESTNKQPQVKSLGEFT